MTVKIYRHSYLTKSTASSTHSSEASHLAMTRFRLSCLTPFFRLHRLIGTAKLSSITKSLTRSTRLIRCLSCHLPAIIVRLYPVTNQRTFYLISKKSSNRFFELISDHCISFVLIQNTANNNMDNA